MKYSLYLFAACLLLNLTLSMTIRAEEPERVYELRTYVTNPGKLDALLQRFRDHTCRLFEKHGMENIGYWLPTDPEQGSQNTLIYLLGHKSIESAKESFAAFGKDTEWQAARKASEEAGKILSKPPQSLFLRQTDYSPAIKVGVLDAGVFELRTYTTAEGKLPLLHERFKNHTMALFTKHGMNHLGYWTPIKPADLAANTLIYMLWHKSREAAEASFKAFRADPVWVEAKSASEKDGPLTLAQPEGVKSIFLKVTDFSPIH